MGLNESGAEFATPAFRAFHIARGTKRTVVRTPRANVFRP